MAFEQLERALDSLSKSVSHFHVGADSIDDLKPLEVRISDLRKLMKVQKTHWQMVNAKIHANSVTENPQEDISTTISNSRKKISHLQTDSQAIGLCLYSLAIHDMVYKEKPNRNFKEQVLGYMKRLFVLNDSLLSIHQRMEALRIEELDLKIECQKELFNYRQFLRDQENLLDRNLQETNPEIVKNKTKLLLKLRKINVMKRLTTAILSTSGTLVREKPFLFNMMKKHREIINIETIIEMTRDAAAFSDTR
ncbi:uncharacterized protein LOC105686357 isoform X2 [Athalia rosae]|nr:uncharacterized protein LOC105686357 isoform X2 [Athalia rosae]XP_048508298.1 uncharacterized protein LOC105686357 isoform X2 [Athalia rosae]